MNVIAILTAVISIAELIIITTKEKVREKINPVVWACGVCFVCSIGGVVFDKVFNTPIINIAYVLEAIFVIVVSTFAPAIAYDGAKIKIREIVEFANKILDILKKVMK